MKEGEGVDECEGASVSANGFKERGVREGWPVDMHVDSI